MASKLWGARFTGSLSQRAEKFTSSIHYDSTLAFYDCVASLAHAKMLGKQKIIPQKDARAIVRGLNQMIADIQKGSFRYDPKSEDIHTDIQNKLKKLIGAPADRLHTARSRNDQVVTDLRLYGLHHLEIMQAYLDVLQIAIIRFAEKNQDVIIPAYTHLQSAQVVLLAHHLLAYVEMLERDKGRLADAAKRMSLNTLGACALSGTTLPTDRFFVSEELGFLSTASNSMDAVSDRDFLMEMLSAMSIVAIHFSRMAEDLILWMSQEFHFIDIDDAFCTGSSIMPHKKNPDVLELIRGSSAQFPSRLMEILMLMKGLPLTYNRDMQLDKPGLFDAVQTMEEMILLMAELFSGITVQKEKLQNKVEQEAFFSVDILDDLVKKGLSYRQAHDIVGLMVKECLDQGVSLKTLSLKELQKFSPLLDLNIQKLLTAKASVQAKKSYGSTNPKMVAQQIALWKKRLKP